MRLDLPDQSSGTGGYPTSAEISFRNEWRTTPPAPSRNVEEVIAGLVLYRIENGTVEYLLMKKTHLDDWSPPKGHVEEGEDFMEGAEREVFEETGLAVGDYETLEQYPIYFEYKTRQQAMKSVHLWAARYLNLEKPITLSPEHDEFQWLDYEATTAVVKRQYKEALMAADLVIRTYESL